MNIRSRSNVTIEDLNAKHGTLLNGVQIRGQKKTLSEATNEVQLGLIKASTLRYDRATWVGVKSLGLTYNNSIIWQPVVLSFSFTTKELRADPWAKLRESLEQLDIKFSAEYEEQTSHVVSKKRNTSKGLQALINGKYIVTDSFINAIVDAAAVPDGADSTTSSLEQDFEGSWPNPLEHLPPRGEEPSDRPAESYAPDNRRHDVFEGYTFVFYEKKQYENLFPAISHGKGKALLKEVTPNETDVDDFIRYVKGVAGEKGLGSFEDGSEGRGVVVVRYMPSKGADTEWFAQFVTSFALRLDHRPVDQREFLEAILACDASMLRQPLKEVGQSQLETERNQEVSEPAGDQMEVDRPQAEEQEQEQVQTAPAPAPAPPQRRGRARRGVASRFKGFDFGSDEETETPTPVPEPEPELTQVAAASQDSLFVSQHQGFDVDAAEAFGEEEAEVRPARKSQRKRPLSPLPEHDGSAFMDALAPTAAAAKRRRIDSGQPAVPPPPPEPEAMDEDVDNIPESPPAKPSKTAGAKGRGKKPDEGEDILELARQRREEQEAQAAAERTREQKAMPDDEIDYAAIRALHIIEECEVHFPDPQANRNSRDQAIAEGRWDPRWNGRKNFKRFRKQGEPAGRAPARIIVGLEEVKPKEYGIGDDYWLENDGPRRNDTQSQSQAQTQSREKSGTDGSRMPPPPPTRRTVIALDSSDEEDTSVNQSTNMEDDLSESGDPEPPRSRAAKIAEKAANSRRSQQTQSQSQSAPSARASKRAAPVEPASKEPAAKRPRRGLPSKEIVDSDDGDGDASDDDELKFRFRKRK